MSGCPLKTLFQHILRDFSCFYQLDHILWTYLLLTTYQDYLLSICKYFISSLFDMATKPVLSFWLILKTLRFRAVLCVDFIIYPFSIFAGLLIEL